MSKLLLVFSLLLSPVPALKVNQVENINVNYSTQGIEPRKDDIRYRYKVFEDGYLYKRLYNYTEQKWVGDWIRCR